MVYCVLANYGTDFRQHPQLLHHRACGPWQDHAVGPHPRAHARHQRARAEGADPRRHGPRARARHHDQEPSGVDGVQGAGRQDVPLQPPRHARPRGLRLRSEPFNGRVRGRAPRGGRRAGRGGPDSREHLLRDGREPRDRARPQQGGPPRRRREGGEPRDRGHPRDPDGRPAPREREDGRGMSRGARGDREAHPAAEDARRGRAPARARVRQRVR